MKVSIVIPSFKRSDYLERLLLSIENQTFKDFEVIIVDDHSPNQNDYEKVIKLFSDKFFNLTYLTNDKNSGAPHSRNRGIKLSKGSLIALVDDDDEWLPTKLEKQVAVFNYSSDSLGIVYTWADVVDTNRVKIDENREVVVGDGRSNIINRCFICSPSVMVRKVALLDSGLFDESFPSCQDWDMWTRVLFNGYECSVVQEALVYYYKHDGPTIGTSPRAILGFSKYYFKHVLKLIRYLQFRHLYRMVIYKIRSLKPE